MNKVRQGLAVCMLVGFATACTKTEVKPDVANTAHISNIRTILPAASSDKDAPAVMPPDDEAKTEISQ